MALTPEEEAELAQLEALENPSTLTPEEQAELQALEALEQPTTPTGDQELDQAEAAIAASTQQTGMTLVEQKELQDLEQLEKQSGYQQFISRVGDGIKDAVIDTPAANFAEAKQDAESRITDSLSGNAFQKILGGLDYLMSPISVPVDAVVGIPLRNVAKETFGISDETAEAIRSNSNFATELFAGTGEAKLVRDIFTKANPAADAAKVSKEAMDAVPARPQAPASVPNQTRLERVNQVVDPESPIGKLTTKVAKKLDNEATHVVLTPEANKGMIDAVMAASNGQFDESKRVMEEVVGNLFQGNFDPTVVPKVLEKYDIDPAELAVLMKDTASNSGRILQQYSTLSKQLRHVYKDNPRLLAQLDSMPDLEKAETFAGKGMKLITGATNAWRAMLVTQPATAARNIATQMGRVSVSALDEGLQPLFKGQNMKATMADSFNGLNALTSLYSQTTKKGRSNLVEIFDTARGSVAEGKLFGQPVHEIAGVNKVIKTANFFNRTQENFTRKVAFESSLRSQLQQAGKKFSTVKPDEIPKKMFDNAVEHALTMSMAADAKSDTVNTFIRAWASNPATASVMPFPRFAFGNLLPFMVEHSPIGYMKAVSPETLTKVAKGDSKEFAQASSRATLGTLGLTAALNIRTDPNIAGEEWYQIKDGENGNQRADQRAFAPFSLYLLEAEMITAPHNVEAADIIGGFVGIGRPAGNALVLGDAIRQKTDDGFWKLATRSAGTFMAGYTTFFRSFKDVNTLNDPQQSLARDTRSDDMLANLVNPTVNNFPFIDKYLPESYTLMRDSAVRYESPTNIPGTNINVGPEGNTLLRQVTGRTTKTPTELEKKVVEVQLKPSYYNARTGVADADREIHKIGGPLARAGFENLSKQGWFKDSMHAAWKEDGLSEDSIRFIQAKVVGDMLSAVKKVATKQMAATRPDLMLQVMEKRAFTGLDGQMLESIMKDRTSAGVQTSVPAPATTSALPAAPVQPTLQPPSLGPGLNVQ